MYQGRDTYPLFHTLQPFLYANRFSGADETLFHLYNATGHTFDDPVLSLTLVAIPHSSEAGDNLHAIELLRGEALPIVDGKVKLYIEHDDVACIALLPRLLQVNPKGRMQIGDGKGGQLVVVNEKGENVLSQEVTGKGGALNLSKLPANTKPTCLKLLRAGRRVDTVQWR